MSGFKKRKHVRVKPEKGRPIRVDMNGENFLDVLYANDISEGGVGIYVTHGFKDCEIDKPVSLVIHLPEPVNYTFSVTGKIRHITGDIFGVILQDKQGFNRRKFRKYVYSRMGEESLMARIKYKLGFN